LALTDSADVEAAIRFFTMTGDFRFDDLHPTGSERAARIAACAAVTRPPRSIPRPVTIAAPTIPLSVYGCEVQLWIDRVPVGTVSNVRAAARTVTLRTLDPGVRAYTIVLQLYHLDRGYQLVPVGTVQASGTLQVAAGDTLRVDWTPGEPPTLRSAR
jgi:hypothetical protein